MLVPIIVLAFGGAAAGLYRYFRKHSNGGMLWPKTVLIGLAIGMIRAVLASIGWYTVEHTGGPLQIPGFALAMLAWPEAVILPRNRFTPVTPGFYLLLSSLLMSTSVLLVVTIAAGAKGFRPRWR